MENSRSVKEQRIREITLAYYSRPEVKQAMFEFSKNRECVPRYFEGFGKRPDSFQYPSDIFEFTKKGATSFHCSEELWTDPLEISTDLSPKEFNEIRQGWDLLLDIDSPYLEYSKIFADLLIKTLKNHHIQNFGVKFSGSKGFHVIIPWGAFPEEIYGQKTREMFPEWPRVICNYLTETIRKKLADGILETDSLKNIAKKIGKTEEELIFTECLSCHRPAEKKDLVTWICENCNKIGELKRVENKKHIPKCPECRRPLIEATREQFFICDFCNLTSLKNPDLFSTREKTESLIEADLVLVAPRHLFRMPYSLHEKTALSSVVIDPNKILEFQITDARPFDIKIKPYYLQPKKDEAKYLLLQALAWKEQNEKQENQNKEIKYSVEPAQPKKQNEPKDFQKVSIPNPTEDLFPPCIRNLLKGVKDDGRKRAMFLLMNFFKSLGMSDNEIEKRIDEWNSKNYSPLKKGYINAQFIWYKRNQSRLPPNCDKTNYKELNICKPDELCKQIKNPINYTFRKYFRKGQQI